MARGCHGYRGPWRVYGLHDGDIDASIGGEEGLRHVTAGPVVLECHALVWPLN